LLADKLGFRHGVDDGSPWGLTNDGLYVNTRRQLQRGRKLRHVCEIVVSQIDRQMLFDSGTQIRIRPLVDIP
jgi:hypothetical protein